jgi:hypothetical protein
VFTVFLVLWQCVFALVDCTHLQGGSAHCFAIAVHGALLISLSVYLLVVFYSALIALYIREESPSSGQHTIEEGGISAVPFRSTFRVSFSQMQALLRAIAIGETPGAQYFKAAFDESHHSWRRLRRLPHSALKPERITVL